MTGTLWVYSKHLTISHCMFPLGLSNMLNAFPTFKKLFMSSRDYAFEKNTFMFWHLHILCLDFSCGRQLLCCSSLMQHEVTQPMTPYQIMENIQLPLLLLLVHHCRQSSQVRHGTHWHTAFYFLWQSVPLPEVVIFITVLRGVPLCIWQKCPHRTTTCSSKHYSSAYLWIKASWLPWK